MKKVKTARDEVYLGFIRSLPCCVTGRTDSVVAHHVRLDGDGGTGLKPSDYYTVPISQDLHQRLHDMGERSFWGSMGMSHNTLVCNYMGEYLVEIGYGLELRRTIESLMKSLELLERRRDASR